MEDSRISRADYLPPMSGVIAIISPSPSSVFNPETYLNAFYELKMN
jgi:hypothetical protein